MERLPHVLISNDDGVNAPGLQALVSVVSKAGFCKVSVCGPATEQSAKSHSLTLGKVTVATRIEVDGIIDAYAVNGTPADSVMLALKSDLLSDRKVDLVVSGINRGENCGYHVVYSGTVGAAREGALKGVPAIALSLNYFGARTAEQFNEAATASLPLIKGMLGLSSPAAAPPLAVVGYVMNVNFPGLTTFKGLSWSHQGTSCVYSNFTEIEKTQEASKHLLRQSSTSHAQDYAELLNMASTREFLCEYVFQPDDTAGSDIRAVEEGYISITPLKILSDIRELSAEDLSAEADMAAVVRGAAVELGMEVLGMPAKYLTNGNRS